MEGENQANERKYWIIALPRDRMQFCMKVGVFGLNRKFILGKVQKGDGIACYVTKDCKFVGFGSVTEPYYLTVEPIFTNKEIFGEGYTLFPDRINFECEPLSSQLEVEFKPLINQMHFISNPKFWTVHFSVGILEIPEEDWNTIISQRR